MPERNPKPSAPSLSELGLRALFLVWGVPHGSHRSQLMAYLLGMEVVHVASIARKGWGYALLKYPLQMVKTVGVLAKFRPRIVFVQNPPIFAVLVVYLWGWVTGTRFIIDSHTDALLASWWRWTLPLHRFLSRRAIVTLVTNEYLRQIVAGWGAPAFILADPPATFPHRRPPPPDGADFRVVVVSTASYDEPIGEVLQAAARLPSVRFYITGNYRAPEHRSLVEAAPSNVRFTGYLADADYYGLLESAHAVMCLTTEDHTIQSGASEALWLGRPIITSDWPVLRAYFCRGTVHVNNNAESICHAIGAVQRNHATFEADIRALQADRRREWHRRASQLVSLIRQAVAG
ncbi:MAG: glycosyltransferase family 1 protein [Caldilineae bacterium]|nr:MAG: glycosyltransferase family 1 protein [Caldilineae bacterium]